MIHVVKQLKVAIVMNTVINSTEKHKYVYFKKQSINTNEIRVRFKSNVCMVDIITEHIENNRV